MREPLDELLIKRTQDRLNKELKNTIFSEEDMIALKKKALQRPLAVKCSHFLEKETRLNITAVAACLLLLISVGGYYAHLFLSIDSIPAEPILIEEIDWQAWLEPVSEREG